MSQIDIKIDPKIFNPNFLQLYFESKRRNIIYGGRDSGKTHGIAQILVLRCLSASYFKCILVRKRFNSIKESQWSKIKSVVNDWGLENEFTFTKSPLGILCKNGNRFMGLGLDNPYKAKSIDDPTHAWYEEADEITENDFEGTTLSLRNSKGVPIEEFISFNPEDRKSWVVDYFFPPLHTFEREDGLFTWVDSIRNDTVILHTSYLHNTFITKDRISLYEDMKQRKPKRFRVHGAGLFGDKSDGLIYPDWSKIDEMPKDLHRYFIGIDFGYTDPSTAIRVGVNKAGNSIYIDELIFESKLDILKFSEKLRSKGVSTNEIGVYDAAEPGSGQILRQKYGYTRFAKANKEPGSIVAGIKLVKTYDIFVTKRSLNTIEELEKYSWAVDRHGNSTGEPIDKFNHALDAIRYVVYTKLSGGTGMVMG